MAVVATRISVTDCQTVLERHEPPPCAWPSTSSSVRIRCTLSRSYWSRRLGDGGDATRDRRDDGRGGAASSSSSRGEQTFFVYDPSLFLRYEDTRRAFLAMLASMAPLRGVDASPDKWVFPCPLDPVAATMLGWARRHEDTGLAGGRYSFAVAVAMEVRLVYSEPRAVVRACADNVMQTAEPGSADHQCSICVEGFGSAGDGPMASVNLPCSHPFHAQCITVWLFRGHSCPVCRHDLRGLVSAPWAAQAPKYGYAHKS